MAQVLRISRRNARFQQWGALLKNRNKRQRAGEFLVHGVRPISLAVQQGWDIKALLYDADRSLSSWARELLDTSRGHRVAMVGELLRELSEKEQDTPEIIAVVALPSDDFARISVGPDFLGVVFDRPSMPGNIGGVVRSVDAFGGSGLVITGHSSDPYDPKSVRASTGSLFSVPVVRSASHREVIEWVAQQRVATPELQVVGTDEHGTDTLSQVNLQVPTLLVVGNETSGLSAGWKEACDVMASIPMSGTASSLNAASAATVALYEAVRQRG